MNHDDDLGLASLPEFPGQEHFIHYTVHLGWGVWCGVEKLHYLIEVEDEVKLTDIVEILVEHLGPIMMVHNLQLD